MQDSVRGECTRFVLDIVGYEEVPVALGLIGGPAGMQGGACVGVREDV